MRGLTHRGKALAFLHTSPGKTWNSRVLVDISRLFFGKPQVGFESPLVTERGQTLVHFIRTLLRDAYGPTCQGEPKLFAHGKVR